MKRVAICLIAVFGVACYRYAPATSAVPSSARVVRLQLSPTGAQTMSRVLGRDAVVVEGTILSADDTSYAMAVTATRRADNQPQTWAGEHVIVPRSAVQSMQARSLDRKKTLMIAGLVVLGAVGLKVLISGIDALAGGDDGGISPPPP
jgi:hypothetical protein